MNIRDIETRDDIDRLLEQFYETAMVDPEIAHHFTELDLVTHLPVIGDFWEKLLFSRPVYFGNPLVVHKQLHDRSPLEAEHFARWVDIFRGIVDSMFVGPRADLAKGRAEVIADTLNQRLNPTLNIHPQEIRSMSDERPV